MAQELKVGDRVRIITNPYSHLIPQVRPGDEFTVARVRPGDDYPYELEGVQRPSGSRWGFSAHEVEKVEPQSRFKVGDRVRLATDHYFSDDEFGTGPVYNEAPNGTGSIGVITATDDLSRPGQHVRVKWDGGVDSVIATRSLEKVQSVPFKLERGDRVVNIKTGREGEVIRDLVYDVKPPFGAPVPARAIEEYEEHHPGTYDLIKGAPW